jgi:hypothetical protein
MDKVRFVATGLATSLVNLVLHGTIYFVFLKGYYAAHPAGSADFLKQLNKGGDQMVLWSLLLSALALGFFITIVVRWSGAKTFATGLGAGALFGGLYWAGMDFGLYASSNIFSLASTLVDIVCSAMCMALSSGFAAWMLHRGDARRTSRDSSAHAAREATA